PSELAGDGDGRGAAGHERRLVDAGTALLGGGLLVLLLLLDGGRVGSLSGGVLSGRLSLDGRGCDGLLLLSSGEAASGQGQAGQGGDCGETGDGLLHDSLLLVYDRTGSRGCQGLAPSWLPLT